MHLKKWAGAVFQHCEATPEGVVSNVLLSKSPLSCMLRCRLESKIELTSQVDICHYLT